MKTLKLTDQELETLILILNEAEVCLSGCIVEEYQDEDFDCEDCPFEQSKWDIWEKLMEIDCEDDPAYR
ncbi:MAG: hypothetical protein ACLS90_00220 [Clostridia bacterium]|jgi:hypothetical protein